jgi:alpha-tubulin suppressor-like RCC1 family protein
MLVALVVACQDDPTPLDLADDPAVLSPVSGTDVRSSVGASEVVEVRLTDAEGRPVPGYPVDFSVSGGSVDADSSDATGLARAVWTMPAEAGFATLTASAEGVQPVTIRASVSPISAGNVVFRFLDAGGYHACGITTTEELLCWGYNADGQLGLGSSSPKLTPTLIAGDFRYRMVTGGYYHSCALTLATNAYCWGQANEGRLGNGSGVGEVLSPARVMNGAVQLTVQVLQAGWAHSCGIDLVQRVWCWGRSVEGQSGATDDVLNAFPVPTTEAYKWVTVGGHHSCGITTGGDARCWGWNAFGQLGDGTNATTNIPQNVPGAQFRIDPLVIFRSPDPDFPLPPGPFIAGGYDHSCGITTGNTAVCWGLNQNGQLGDNTRQTRNTPGTVAGGHTFVAATAGLRHTCALDSSGAAWCWGANDLGQVGNGAAGGDVLVPAAVEGGLEFAYIKAGELFTCGVTSEGVAYCWGDNEYGQLGVGDTTGSNVPIKVAFQP